MRTGVVWLRGELAWGLHISERLPWGRGFVRRIQQDIYDFFFNI